MTKSLHPFKTKIPKIESNRFSPGNNAWWTDVTASPRKPAVLGPDMHSVSAVPEPNQANSQLQGQHSLGRVTFCFGEPSKNLKHSLLIKGENVGGV
jgi:hypothetical protein